MKSSRLSVLITVFLVGTLVAFPAFSSPRNAHAAEFNRHFLLSDHEFFDSSSMSLEEIQRFLEQKQSFLATFVTRNHKGTLKKASEIVSDAAQEYTINPRVLLALLQKEQSLIETQFPTNDNLLWATGFGVCDSCSKSDPGLQKYSGFGTQVDRAAWRFRYYVDHPEEFNFQIGKIHAVDDIVVVPANQATVNLYNYTPHLHGNENFVQIWQRYFVRNYPDGSLLQVNGQDGVWLIQHGFRRPFLTKAALTSRFDQKRVISVEQSDIEKYDIGRPLKHPNFSYLRSPAGTVYLLVDDTKRGFTSREALRQFGVNPEEILDVDWEDVNLYSERTPILEDTDHPSGTLLQDSSTGGVYFVLDGKKHPLVSREILKRRFGSYPIRTVSLQELLQYETVDPVGFSDGELVTSADYPQVFVISNGLKRPIVSAEVFKELGYRWDQIIYTSNRALEIHQTGQPITL